MASLLDDVPSTSVNAQNILESTLDAMKSLPLDMHRELMLMRELDARVNDTRRRILRLQAKVLDSAEGTQIDQQALSDVRRLEKLAFDLTNEKIAIARQWYEDLQQYATRVEDDLEVLTTELPINGALAKRSDSDLGDESRVWCSCKQNLDGQMIACDEPSCAILWYHTACVGLTKLPKANWYCPTCTIARQKLGL